ncbi:MAG: SDR family NAD(P)-dependent oxidoreductase [Candidatus Muirbacterium halophilum]|nr:SDR family NAD(P)-dependent oxidoreductase [Candidatus Muirbacterium halophilum]MCK9474601.1 SDR family NAD(P)-dependent oxidoreductase [Candidatus Muirbacterium halophilum]
MKTILITGGLGMIGSSIALELFKLGHKIILLDFFDPKYGANLNNIKEIKDNIEIINLDIRDFEKISYRLKDIDIIFNMAGQINHNLSLENPIYDAEINYMGHLRVLEEIRKHNPSIKIIYSGTRLQYGKIDNNPVLEDHAMEPLTPYALNKMAAESIYLYYYRMFGIRCTCFRITNPYGPRGQIKHSGYGIVNWFIRQAIENREISIYGDGKQKRDYIFIDDLVCGLIKSAFSDTTDGKVYNLGSGNGICFIDMAETIIRISGSGKINLIDWPENYINVETGDFIADISKLKNDIEWSPVFSLEVGIEKTIDFYKENYDIYVEKRELS